MNVRTDKKNELLVPEKKNFTLIISLITIFNYNEM